MPNSSRKQVFFWVFLRASQINIHKLDVRYMNYMSNEDFDLKRAHNNSNNS